MVLPFLVVGVCVLLFCQFERKRKRTGSLGVGCGGGSERNWGETLLKDLV